MNHEWLFLKMRSSNELLGDPGALRARLDEDSYLYFEQVLDPDKVMRLRRAILDVLADSGWIRGGLSLHEAQAVCRPLHEGMEGHAPVYDKIQCLEEFHTLAHDDDLRGVMTQVVGETAFAHPLKICRVAFPDQYEASTPPHQDFPNNQGTPNLTASWIPVGDVPMDLGSLAVLRGSHRYGLLPLTVHMGPGRRQAKLPEKMLEDLRWVTADFRTGDVVLFPSLTVHAALHNITEFDLRLSVDYRWQQAGEALTDVCLHPHFQRVTWEQVYEHWKSDRYQYYWKDLDYQVVPFEELDVERPDKYGAAVPDGFSKEEWVEILTVDRRWDSRYERRIERLAEASRHTDG